MKNSKQGMVPSVSFLVVEWVCMVAHSHRSMCSSRDMYSSRDAHEPHSGRIKTRGAVLLNDGQLGLRGEQPQGRLAHKHQGPNDAQAPRPAAVKPPTRAASQQHPLQTSSYDGKPKSQRAANKDLRRLGATLAEVMWSWKRTTRGANANKNKRVSKAPPPQYSSQLDGGGGRGGGECTHPIS